MRICVARETVYRYDTSCTGMIQTLRLTPRNHAGQYVVNWRIDVSANCRLEPVEDAFGNIIHTFSLSGPVAELRLMVDGEVETQDTAGVVKGAVERFPPSLFLRETALTRPDAALLPYAARCAASSENTLSVLHDLLTRVHRDFARDDAGDDDGQDHNTGDASGETVSAAGEVALSAADAFKAGRGTSRDIAHIFIAAARTLGVPARYVTGYVGSRAGHTAVHEAGDRAWCEAYIVGLGWVGFDPAHGICSTDRYVRVAIGLDWLSAAPIRGSHYGGGREDVAVRLEVIQASRQTQE
jgi:transglutaminase-like putative cysteine protease